MDSQGKEEFSEKLKETKEFDEEQKNSYVKEKEKEITEGIKYVPTSAWGTIYFQYPSLGQQLGGDKIFLETKHKYLLSGSIMSRKKMETLLGNPHKIDCPHCGEKIEIGSGEWTEEKENKIKKLNEECQEAEERFNAFRKSMQEIVDKIGPDLSQEETKKLEDEREIYKTKSFAAFEELVTKRAESISLLYQKYDLFQGCIEEVSDHERTKYLAPFCIRKLDGSQLWKDQNEMMASGNEAGRVFGLFHFFTRGIDVSFFGELAGILNSG